MNYHGVTIRILPGSDWEDQEIEVVEIEDEEEAKEYFDTLLIDDLSSRIQERLSEDDRQELLENYSPYRRAMREQYDADEADYRERAY